MDAFSWINDFLRWLIHFVPRLGICRATHGGVKFVRGKHIKEIQPGLYFWWPVTTEIEIIPVARQSANLAHQVLTTSDGITVMVSAVIIVKITNVIKALGQSWSVDETIDELGNTAVVKAVSSRTFASLRKEVAGEVPKELTRRLQQLLRPYGVKVVEGRLSDLAKAQVIRTVGNGDGAGADVLPLV